MSPDPETAWNDQVAWLQRLARRLVRDECLADDMAQEAVLAALRAGRADAPRAWWIGVVRNLARDEARSAGRRRAREESVFRAADAPPTHEVVGEAEAQRRISDAVL
ncbi:MAG: sigma factor, partial [Planctomycetota bacterium]